MSPGKLNVVTVPIGNYADLTIRGIRLIEESDLVACEEYKEAVRLLNFFGIKKELLALNEHNETESTSEILDLLLNGKTVSLISDSGVPGFSDPGNLLLNKCIELEVSVEFCGGANSLLTAIVLSGFDISRFYFAGFLSPKKEIRRKELSMLFSLERPVALMEAPYRLAQILEDISDSFGDRRLFVGFDLTQENEIQFRGSAREIISELGGEKIKGEFIIVIDKS